MRRRPRRPEAAPISRRPARGPFADSMIMFLLSAQLQHVQSPSRPTRRALWPQADWN